MLIKKDLKNATFEYDESSKIFTIAGHDHQFVELNKVYAFAFMRFVVRMAQRNWLRQPQKTKNILEEAIDEIGEDENSDHPDQMNLFSNDN